MEVQPLIAFIFAILLAQVFTMTFCLQTGEDGGVDYATISAKLKQLDLQLANCNGVDDIREVTILQIQNYYESGQLTSVHLTRCFLQRIQEMDPFLSSVIEVNPDALTHAKRMDEELSLGRSRGLLHGIPVLIKDNIGTLDGTQTTAGAKAMEWVKPRTDAEVVSRLRDAGAIILGKTNPSEWAYFRDHKVPSGWSGRGGQTLSLYNLTSDPSGSSTGTAVALAANFAAASLGTETRGSIIYPASAAALVGIKTTLGTVSGRGVIPLAPSQDVVGPMARTVSDAAILLSIISNLAFPWEGGTISPVLRNEKFRVGALRETFSTDLAKERLAAFDAGLKALKSSRYIEVVDPIHIISSSKLPKHVEDTIFEFEFKRDLNKYLQKSVEHLEGPYLSRKTINSLEDVIRFNEDNPDQKYGQQKLLKANKWSDDRYIRYPAAQKASRQISQTYLDDMFSKYELDVLVSLLTKNSPDLQAARAGYPSMTISIGEGKDGAPFGMILVGKAFAEESLIKVGHVLETAMKKLGQLRSLPRFLF